MRSQTCLNGFWDFAPAGRDDRALPTAWDAVKIQVPSPFNINSFSHPYPKNTAGEEYLVQGGDFRLYPEYPAEWDDLSAGYYRRTLDIPARRGDERLFLHFDAVAFRSEYYLNGEKIGEFADGFMPYEVEITSHVRWGETNELIVRAETVKELIYTDAEGKRRADYPHGSFWGGHIGGIWQDAWLVERPAGYVADIFAVTDVYQKTLTVRYETADAAGRTIRFFLQRWGDDTAAEREILSAPAGETGELCWQYADGDVALWELDAPALYTLTARLYDGEKMTDETSVRIGFRTFTAEGDHFLLNGRPLRLKNDSWHYMGYSIQTPAYARSYYRMAKDAHVNIIRLHAQPFPSFFFDVADEEGMLLVSESCVWASHCIFSYNEDFFRHSREHVARWVRRDRNHPSVVMWSPENECIPAYKVCGSPAIRDVADLEEKLYDLTQVIPPLDNSRLISCDGSGDLGGRMPVNSLHYPGYGCPVPPERRDRPITIGEMGSMYFSTPDNVCMVDGQSALYSMNGRLTAVGRDAFHNLTGQRKWAGQVCVFNLIWYGLEPLPFADRALTYDDYTAPGIKPSRITPYLRTLNAGGEEGLPEYIPNPVWELTKAAYTPIRFFFENEPSAVFAGEGAAFPLTLFNDDSRERTLTLSAMLTTPGGNTISLGSRTYTLAACTYTEDEWAVAVPMAGDATLAITLTDGEETLFTDSRTVRSFDRSALMTEWNASGVTLLHGEDADATGRVIDCRRAAPYGSFMKSRAVQHLFAADGRALHFTREQAGYYFEEYLNFTGTPLYFNGAGMPVVVDLTPAGQSRILCGIDLSNEEEPLALALRVELARRLAAAAPQASVTAYLYGQADSPVAAMLDEIRCDYALLDDDGLRARLREKQEALLIVDGSRSTRLLEAVSENNFRRVLVLGLTRTPDIFHNLFDVTDRRGFQLCPAAPDAATAGMYGNNLYGLGVGKEEALAERLLQYRAAAPDNILLGLPNIDWRMWNNNAENLKTVSLLRSEQADNSRLAALARQSRAGSTFYFSQLSLNTQSKKAKNLLVRLLSALGASVSLAQNDDLNELLFSGTYGVQVNRMLAHPLTADVTALHPGLNRIEEDAAWRIVQNDRRLPTSALAVFVYSPQDRTDLLLNPDTVDLNVSADSPLTLWLNGEEQGSGTEFTVTSITLTAGWNTLLMRYDGGALPSLKFHRTNLKKLDLKFGLYDADLKPQNMQKAVLSSADRPDGVERAVAGREQHWRASSDQHAGVDFAVAFPAPITARAIYFSGSPSDFDRDVFTPYCFKLLAGDTPEELHEVFRAKFEDKMCYVNGRVFLRLDDVTARCFKLELTHNALKPWIISNLTFLS